MNNYELSKLSMYNAVISFCKQNPAPINSIAALKTAFDSFTGAVDNIMATDTMKAGVISGITEDKNQLRNQLAQQALTIAATVYSYAVSSSNNELKGKVNFTLSDLLRLKDEALPPVCKNIAAAASANLDSLVSYDITTDTISALLDTVENFRNAISLPRNAMSERSAHVATIKELFKTADSVLKGQMDKMISKFQQSNPSFYKTYRNNRIIIDAGNTPTQIKGGITSEKDKTPIHGATIVILENETTASTSEDGSFIIKPLKPGTYTVRISKEGFETKTVTALVVKLGQISVVEMELSPAA